VNKAIEIEKLKAELEKEQNSEERDEVKISKLKNRIFHLGLGLTLNDIKKL
jgi:hypothetical protein